MSPRTIIEALLAKGWKPAGLARALDITDEVFYCLRFGRAEPSRELAARLRLLAGKAPPIRHHPNCQPRFGR